MNYSKPTGFSRNVLLQEQKTFNLLIIEDDPFCQLLIKEFLSGENYLLRFADDGDKALKMYQPGEYDLLLLDIQLPHVNGFDVARRIRRLDPNIPIIAITAYINHDKQRVFDECGINNVIEKPLSAEKMILETRRWIEGVQR